MSEVGEVSLKVVPDMKSFVPLIVYGLKGNAGALTSALNETMSSVGMAAGVTIAAAIAGSIASAVKYEQAFSRIDAITDASAEKIAQWKDELLSLSAETATAPTELADSLYYAASAGLKASQVMPTVAASAKAAQIGLGEAGDVARITAQALNAYSQSGLTVTQVMDALTAAVREGTAEPEQFAEALGRVLPIANQAGVAFDEVVASLSSMSNVGLDVDEGVTALRQLLISLAAPTVRAQEALASLGISTGQLRDTLRTEGVLAAMTELKDAANGNLDALRPLIPNVRALAGGLNLTGDKLRDNKELLYEVTHATGDFSEAWRTTTDYIGFQIRALVNEFRVLAIIVGEALMPAVKVVVSALRGLQVILVPLAEHAHLLGIALGSWLLMKTFPVIIRAVTTAFAAMIARTPTLALLSMAAALLAATDNAKLLLYAFLAYSAIKFVPVLIMSIAKSLAALGAVRAASAIADLGQGLALLPGALTRIGTSLKASKTGLPLLNAILAGTSTKASLGARALGTFATGLGRVGSFMLGPGGIVVGLGAAVTAWGLHQDAVRRSENAVKEAATGMRVISTGPGQAMIAAVDKSTGAFLNMEEGMYGVQKPVAMYAGSVEEMTGIQDKAYASQKALEQSFIDSGEKAYIQANAVEQLSYSIKGIAPSITEVEGTLAAAGMTAEGFSNAAVKAANKGQAQFTKFANDVRTKVGDALADMTADFASGISFMGEAMSTLGEKANASANTILEAFRKASRQTESFGKDLLKIARDGGEALVQQLIAMGPAGAKMANTIAGASDKMRGKIIRAFNDGQSAAADLGSKLTEAVAGTLSDIEAILRRIAKAWGIRVDMVGNAKTQLNEIQNILRGLETGEHKINASIIYHTVREPRAEGGPVTRNMPYVVGEKGPELFVPGVSGRIVPNDQLRMAGGSVSDSGKPEVQVVLDRRRVLSELDHDDSYRGW